MTRFEAWSLHVSTILVAGTGLVYAWMIWFVRPTDPYAIVNHPFQPQVQHAHILVAPLLVFAAGLVWQRHIWAHWRRGVRRGRRSGLGMMLTLVPMVASGYLLQTAVDDSWRSVWLWIHLVTSGLWILVYLGHQVPTVRLWMQRRREAAATSSAPRTSDTRSEAAGQRPFRETRERKAWAGGSRAGAGRRGDR